MPVKKTIRAIFYIGGLLAIGLAISWKSVGAWKGAGAQNGEFPPNWQLPLPGKPFSQGAPFGIDQPVVAVAGANTLVAAFNWHLSSSTGGLPDPYYSVSTNNGNSWGAPVKIFQSPNIESLQVQIASAGDGLVHAVWVEDINLMYVTGTVSGNMINWSSPITLAEPDFDPGVSDPAIVARGGNAVDIFWAESDPFEPNIMHKRRQANGSWLNSETIVETDNSSALPAFAPDAQGGLHLVYEEKFAEIHYSAGTEQPNGQFSWSAPVSLATAYSPGVSKRQPTITILKNGALVVGYNQYASVSEQSALTLDCAANCQQAANWSAPVPAYSQSMTLGATSFAPFITPHLISVENCAYIFFHGIKSGETKELMFNSNSCDNWSANVQQISLSTMQSVHPFVVVEGTTAHLSYALVNSNKGFGHYLRAELPVASPQIFLPYIVK